MPANGKVGIGDPIPPETDVNLTIGYLIPIFKSSRIIIGCHR
jgi:hypothetical protein